jgi:hypothetical protein
METYRVSKYNPKYRDSEGNYTKHEWWSYVEIGEMFDNKLFTIENYLLLENSYISTIKDLAKYLYIKSLLISEMTKTEMLIPENFLKLYEDNLISYYNSLYENQEIPYSDLNKLLKLLLRQDITGHLEDKHSKLSIDFGYDYYMFIKTDKKNKTKLNEICNQNGLFMEDSGFPISFEFEE